MKSSLLAFLLIFSASAKAFDKDFKAEAERMPLEFLLMFDSLKLSIKTPKEKLQLVGLCQELDRNLGFLEKEHIMLLMKSEVIKNVLEYRFPKVRQFDVTTMLIERLEKDLKQKEKYLNPFSLWLWRSVIAELNYRKSLGIITGKSFNPEVFSGSKRNEAIRFKRYLKYLMPWIDQMDSLSAAKFNELTKEVSWVVLRRLNERSLLFRRYAKSTGGDMKTTLFNIPQRLLELHPEEIKKMQQDDTPLTLKEQSEKEKSQALETVEKVTPDDLSTISDDVANEIEKVEQAPN